MTSSRGSPRLRRLRQTTGVVVVTGLLAVVFGSWLYRRSRPQTYRPGEEHAEITQSLVRQLPEGAPEPRFTDVTAEAGLADFRTFAGERSSQLPEDMGSGAAWGDYDNDGDDDLLLVAAGGALSLPEDQRAPTRLYENLGNGRFRPASNFPEMRILGMAAAWGDYDGDGWLDLVLTGYGTLQLLRNEQGRLRPTDRLPQHAGFWAGAVWGDYDNDRDLDLYICGYVRYRAEETAGRGVSTQSGQTVPYTLNPASYEPERNLLFRNDGGGRFTEVAESLGVANLQGRSLGALWHDLDDDGWLDLYVANDVSDNVFYLNRGGRFEDRSHAAWVADYRGAMGLAVGDWNRDGDDDLFVTHWVAQENALYDSLLQDLGTERGLTFADQAAMTGLGQIALASVGWGTEFADLDGDGRLDLVVANGSTFETEDEPKRLVPQPSFLLWNRGDFFHDLAPLHPAWSSPHVSRGLALADYDDDGDLDVLFVDLGEGVRLLRNDMQQGHWIELRLRSLPQRPGGARGFGEGTKVVARAGDTLLRRSVTSASYLSQSSHRLHFGLGVARSLDSLEVRWRAGSSQTFSGLAAGALWELDEGDARPRRVAFGRTEGQRPASRPVGSQAATTVFWERQRAGVHAMKREGDFPRAVTLFRKALAIDPSHEGARYYLANCLAALGRTEEALAELDELIRLHPRSHRAHKQWGALRVHSARSPADLQAAAAALEQARAVNPEETGTLLLLGEVALLLGDDARARQRFEWTCRTNPRAVGGFFLRAYLAWKAGDEARSRELLERARQARGEDWKPAGATAEGDAAGQPHDEATPLSRFWSKWDPAHTGAAAFGDLDTHLRRPYSAAGG